MLFCDPYALNCQKSRSVQKLYQQKEISTRAGEGNAFTLHKFAPTGRRVTNYRPGVATLSPYVCDYGFTSVRDPLRSPL